MEDGGSRMELDPTVFAILHPPFSILSYHPGVHHDLRVPLPTRRHLRAACTRRATSLTELAKTPENRLEKFLGDGRFSFNRSCASVRPAAQPPTYDRSAAPPAKERADETCARRT